MTVTTMDFDEPTLAMWDILDNSPSEWDTIMKAAYNEAAWNTIDELADIIETVCRKWIDDCNIDNCNWEMLARYFAPSNCRGIASGVEKVLDSYYLRW